MSLPPPRKVGAISIILLVVATLTLVLFAIRRDRLLAAGQTLQFDDFFFTLVDAKRPGPIETGAELAADPMVHYVVTLKIDNRAMRVPFRFSDQSLAVIEQSEGRRYYVNAADQKAQDDAAGNHSAGPIFLKAGESATREYIFRVPASVVAPRMRIAPGGWSGLIIDRLLTGTKEFQLP